MGLLCLALSVYNIVLIARIVMSYFPQPPEGLRPVFEFVYSITEPVLRLARPLIPPVRLGMAALDLSPLLVFLLLGLLSRVVCL